MGEVAAWLKRKGRVNRAVPGPRVFCLLPSVFTPSVELPGVGCRLQQAYPT